MRYRSLWTSISKLHIKDFSKPSISKAKRRYRRSNSQTSISKVYTRYRKYLTTFDIEDVLRFRSLFPGPSASSSNESIHPGPALQPIFFAFSSRHTNKTFQSLQIHIQGCLCSHGQFHLIGHEVCVTQHTTMKYVRTCWVASTGRIGLGLIGQYARARDCACGPSR